MLALTRRIGESIVIDGITKITVVRIHNGVVRLAIDAPHNVKVHREEVQRRVGAEESDTHPTEPAGEGIASTNGCGGMDRAV
jgi:carbon storage regulator